MAGTLVWDHGARRILMPTVLPLLLSTSSLRLVPLYGLAGLGTPHLCFLSAVFDPARHAVQPNEVPNEGEFD